MDKEYKLEFTREELLVIHRALMLYSDNVEAGSDEYVKLWDLWKRILIKPFGGIS